VSPTPSARSRSPGAPRMWVAPSRLGRRDVRFGPPGRVFEIAPVAGECGASGVVGGVVVIELPLSLLSDHPADAQV
jgi:hypothetical protein